jgi:phosphoesterase RecJ-like protein
MQELITALRNAVHITLIAHIRPDGDAAGSLIGLAQALTQLGKQVTPVLKDGVPAAFLHLEGADTMQTSLPDQCDLCVVMDAPDSARTGYTDLIKAYGQAGKLGLIDHHMKGDLLKRAQYILYDDSSSSTAELVVQLVEAMELKFTGAVSTALLTGMYTDTGGFQYGNTTTKTLNLAAELMRRGARLNRIVQHVARQRTMPGLKLLGIALSRLTLTPDKKGAVTILSLDDLVTSEATAEDAGGLVSALNVLPEVSYCLLLTELEPGLVRGTFRTSEGHSVDVARLAALFLKSTPTGWRIEPALVS